MKSEVGDW